VGFALGLTSGDPSRTWTAYLVNFLFWTGLSLGAVAFVAVTNVTRARWARTYRPHAAAIAAFLPLAVILFAALVPGIEHVLPWVSHAPEKQAWWLNLPFMATRNVLGLMILSVIGLVLVRRSLQSRSAGPAVLSILYILGYVTVMSVAAVDLVMSADPAWMNTLYPAHFFVGSFCLGMAAIMVVSSARSGSLPSGLRPTSSEVRDLSNLTLGFALFTGYLFYTQVLVIWYGNMPMETMFLIRRTASTSWAAAGAGIVLLSFALPLLVVPMSKAKSNPRVMSVIAVMVMTGLWIERFVVSARSVGDDATLPLGFVEIAVTVGFLGVAGMAILTLGPMLGRVAPGSSTVDENGEAREG
jgi:hypothetical protein